MEETEQYVYPGHLFQIKLPSMRKGTCFLRGYIHIYICLCVYVCVGMYVGEPKLIQNCRMDQNICKLKSE